MKKIELKKIFTPKVVGYLAAGAAAVGAFASQIGSQKKEEEFKKLVEKVNELENKK